LAAKGTDGFSSDFKGDWILKMDHDPQATNDFLWNQEDLPPDREPSSARGFDKDEPPPI
jgi:hypothetical protein